MKQKTFVFAILAGFFFNLLVLPAEAEITRATLTVDGLACPFCAYGIEKKLKKLPGVSKMDIQMKKGKVVLKMKPGESPTALQIKKAVEEAGYTLRKAQLTAIGEVYAASSVSLKVRGTGEALALPAAAKKYAGDGLVAIRGKMSFKGSPRMTSIQSVKKIHHVTFALEGMGCAECPKKIERKFRQVSGVYRVSTNLEKKQVWVETIGKVNEKKLEQIIEKETNFKAKVVR